MGKIMIKTIQKICAGGDGGICVIRRASIGGTHNI